MCFRLLEVAALREATKGAVAALPTKLSDVTAPGIADGMKDGTTTGEEESFEIRWYEGCEEYGKYKGN